TLGPKVRIYVSNSVPVSHLWRGYGHPRDPRGIVFLNQRAYTGALNGRNSTYVHELTHIFTWRYRSLTLREGFADYVAQRLMPVSAVGPNADTGDLPAAIAPEVLEQLGTTQPPPEWVTNDPARRALFYATSYRFVRYLVE